MTGLVSHFTHFALLLIGQDAICPYAGACGGSLEGTWKFSQSCLEAEESEAFDCGTAGPVTLRNEYTIGGTITIAQGRYTANQAIQAKATLYYPPACMALLVDDMPNIDCAVLQEAWRNETPNTVWTCVGTVEQGCSCVFMNDFANTVMGAVAIDGEQVTLTEDNEEPDEPSDFCVKSNILSVRDADGSVYTATKQ